MSIVVVGLDHQGAPLELLEAASIAGDDVPRALSALHKLEHLSEAVVLSTCNRTEVFAVAEKFHPGYHELWQFFTDVAFLDPNLLSEHLLVRHDDDAIEHLFRVATGLESAVLGETEIQGQVRAAWDLARVEGATGPVLNLAFRHALEVGKRARTETSISRHIASISQAAVAMAHVHLDGVAGRRVLVVGAGEMAEGMVRSLAAADPAEVLIANRTRERAEALAAATGCRPLDLSELGAVLPDVDVLLTSTGATSILLDHADLESVAVDRNGRPLLIVDVAVPRDVDPAVADLPDVTLLDMDDIRAFAEHGRDRRNDEIEAVELLIAEEVQRFADARSARSVAPLVTSLHRAAEGIRRGELDRFAWQLAQLPARQRETVEALTKGIVQKLLHGPTTQVKDAAGSSKGDRLADSIRDLFDL